MAEPGNVGDIQNAVRDEKAREPLEKRETVQRDLVGAAERAGFGEQDLRHMLKDLAELVSSAMVEAGLGRASVDEISSLVDHLVARSDPASLFVAGWTHDELARAQPITGSLAEITTAVMVRVRDLSDNRPALRAFYGGTLAATIRRLVGEDIGPVDRHVDLVLDPLRRFGVSPNGCSSSLIEFARGLRAHLDNKPAVEWDGNVIITLVNVGNFVGLREGRECIILGSYYFHEAVTFYLGLAREEQLTPRDRSQVRIAASNSANLIDVLRRIRGLQVDEHPQSLSTRYALKRISAAMSSLVSDAPEDELRLAAHVIDELFGGPLTSLRWPIVIDDMASSPTAWLTEGRDHADLAILEAAASLARIAIEKRRHEAPSTFYNTGVSVLRLVDSDLQLSRRTAESIRARLNGLGLWWALETAHELPLPQSLIVALRDYDGLECAVNLFDAWTTLSPDPARLSTLDQLGRTILHSQPLLASEVHRFFQIENSFRALELTTGEPTGDLNVRVLQDLVAALLDESPLSLREPDPVLRTAQLVTEGVLELFGGPALIRPRVERLVELLQQIEEESRKPLENLKVYYQPMAATGALVASGLIDREEWERTANLAAPEGVTLVDLLRTDTSFAWMLRE